MANKAYKYRLYPNRTQEELIQKTFGCVRFVYNHFLEDRITAYKEYGENRSFFQQNKMLTALKQEYPWLKEPDKNALQNALRDLNAAYQNFFRRVKQGGAPGFPRFKSKKTDRKSYATACANGNDIRISGNKIHFPKLGWVKVIVANQYDYICVEDINYQHMGRGLHLAKATNDNAFGQFRQMLTYKMAERGKKLITIDKWYPSSKTCRFCGNVNSDLTLKDRQWTCPECGAIHDRDINAAINIRNEGLANVS